MKNLIFALSMVSIYCSAFAQDKDHSFKKENIFIGGAIGLGLSGGGFSAGANPEVGYTVAKWFDAGIITNVNYYSYSAEVNNGVRQRSFNYGAGMFVRLYPIPNFFIQLLPEYNWIKTSLKDIALYGTGEEVKLSQEAPSFLLGAGYATREIGNTSFYTVIMFDAGNNVNSPYVGYLGSKYPILRTGFNFYLRPKKK